jgi:hydrogenase maturation protein HypF
MAENDWQEPVIGVSFDGTGYGTDGTIWGGEILKADYQEFERLGHIRPFLQTGGDKASREGWRIAVAMLYELTKDQKQVWELNKKLNLCPDKELAAQFLMADKKLNAIKSTSAGRLFDAVSALLGIRQSSTFEGEASMYLEFAAEAYENRFCAGIRPDIARLEMEKSVLEPETFNSAPFEMPTEKLFAYLLEERLQAGADSEQLAFKFHAGLAAQITKACQLARKKTDLSVVALSGGVFQNHLLMRLVLQALRQNGFTVLKHNLVPPNDGGIALGQAAAALCKLKATNK